MSPSKGAAGLILAIVLCLSASTTLAADMGKTLHVLLSEAETGLDPATASDASTQSINENMFDPLLRYDYLARPVQLVPNTATAMPDVSADKLTYVFHLEPGIRFTPDPVFGGKARELTAADYVYSIKRLYDPALKSPWLFLFEGKLAGDAALRAAPGRRFDIDTPIAGLVALDRHTLRLQLSRPDGNLLFALATPATGAMAREVLEAHAADPGGHPIGTGPYRLALWQRNDRIVLEANPSFRTVVFKTPPGAVIRAIDADLAASLRGRTLPLVGRVDIRIMEEQQARVLGFLDGAFDYLEPLPAALADLVLDDGKLKASLRQRRITAPVFAPLRTFYLWMNMDDPMIGGYALHNIALRRAIGMAYAQAEDIRVLDHGMALAAQSPLPPEVLGYDPAYRSSRHFDPVMARRLLDHYGYRVRAGERYRSLPDGRPLTLTMHSLASTTGRLRDEFWRRSLEAIDIRVTFRSDRFADITKAARLGTVQMFETNWIADFPDGENFYQLLYGGNIGRANYARFHLPHYDRLFEQAAMLPDSPQRTALYRQMNRLIEAYMPWIIRTHPQETTLLQPWLKNYQRHPVENTAWRYLDVDADHQRSTPSPAARPLARQPVSR